MSGTPADIPYFRHLLLEWYANAQRDLPWRRTRDPYRIWVSEIMLQQTRVAAAIPYYEKFVERFPSIESLAVAPEAELLHAWAGLGYYSRARNLQRAAVAMAATGSFPVDFASIRELPGIGDYTAAAVGSIAFGLPHAAVDGNVIRVLSRVANENGDVRAPATRQRLREIAEALVDPTEPGAFNQAMMELGATVCTPKAPKCLLCPVSQLCAAFLLGRQNELPVASPKGAPRKLELALFLVRARGATLLWRRAEGSKRLAGFWELPEAEQIAGLQAGDKLGAFRHTIVDTTFEVTVHEGKLRRAPRGFEWVADQKLQELPLSTITKKALRLLPKEKS